MTQNFDLIIIGGGATGLGTAVEAATRGYKTLLVEAYDYGKGTSSKSTKLVHGGIRYLANFDFALVQEGLEERYYFLKNAPHLAYPQSYLIPFQSLMEKIKYWLGIKLYDFLAGKRQIGPSKFLSKKETLLAAPDLAASQITGGAIYQDGQFDDCRMLIALLNTFEAYGGTACNYHKVIDFVYDKHQKINGIITHNQLTNEKTQFNAQLVINATGTFSDTLMNLADPAEVYTKVAAAQGTHLVFERNIFDSKHAILVPETSDGRVLFILPWHDKVVVGTTDILVAKPSLEPIAKEEEVSFILTTLNKYTNKTITHKDIKSIFCGQRPLVKSNKTKNTAKISRKHEIFHTPNGLITIVGGKWTIYRRMGQDTINYIEKTFNLAPTKSISANLHLSGYTTKLIPYPLSMYGSNAEKITKIQQQTNNFALIHPQLPYLQAEIIYHIHFEHAKTIEDILLRRTRAIFLNAQAAKDAAPLVAKILAKEFNYNKEWEIEQINSFNTLAKNFGATEN